MEPLAHRIREKLLPNNGRVLVMPMKTPDVVTIKGSVFGGWNYLPRELGEVPLLAAELYDAGTKRKSKAELREALAKRGATISFWGGGDRTFFTATCLPEDFPFVLSVITECLDAPLFSSEEFELARTRMLSDLQDTKTKPYLQARDALLRLVYEEAHVNYAETDTRRERYLKSATTKELATYHTSHVGRGGLVLAITGDIDPAHAIHITEKTFTALQEGTSVPSSKKLNKKEQKANVDQVFIPKKASIDMFLGAHVPLYLEDQDFLPLSFVTNMLGGTFSAHLMQTVRERDGLTYGIRAGLDGFAPDTDGYFYIWSTFAPELFSKGVTVTLKETKRFLASSLTARNLEKKKAEIAGAYAIGLSTTDGMAEKLLDIGVRGKEKEYIDTYLELIRRISLSQAKKAAEMIPVNKLALAAAGTFIK